MAKGSKLKTKIHHSGTQPIKKSPFKNIFNFFLKIDNIILDPLTNWAKIMDPDLNGQIQCICIHNTGVYEYIAVLLRNRRGGSGSTAQASALTLCLKKRNKQICLFK